MSEYQSVSQCPRINTTSQSSYPIVNISTSNTLFYVLVSISIVLSLMAITLSLVNYIKNQQSSQATEKEFKKWMTEIISQQQQTSKTTPTPTVPLHMPVQNQAT